MPSAASCCISTVALISSLSISTPSQSKMIREIPSTGGGAA